MKCFIFFILIAVPFILCAQTISNIQTRQAGKTVIVSYDLTGGESGQTFTVNLLVSEDGGKTWSGPLQEVSGAVGSGIKAGFAQQIDWDVLSEPGRDKLQGDRIGFKVRAEYFEKPMTTASGYGKPCPGMPKFIDFRDGQIYPTVQIGTQCWMQKNMNYQTGNSWYYDDNAWYYATYGRLYDWETAKKACPPGWHLPSDAEWQILVDLLGGDGVAGGKMKESGTSHWSAPNKGATKGSGLTALPGGHRVSNGNFEFLKYNTYFWSSTECSYAMAWYRLLYYDHEYVYRGGYFKTYGYSVRCLRD